MTLHYACPSFSPFVFIDTAPTEIYTLSLHDALPIFPTPLRPFVGGRDAVELEAGSEGELLDRLTGQHAELKPQDRKSTRLNSSHTVISYAVFCLKKKKKNRQHTISEPR